MKPKDVKPVGLHSNDSAYRQRQTANKNIQNMKQRRADTKTHTIRKSDKNKTINGDGHKHERTYKTRNRDKHEIMTCPLRNDR